MRSVRSATTHVLQALLEAALISSLIVVLIAGTAFAAKGGASGTGGHKGGGSAGTGTISMVLAVDNNGNGSPNWGDWVSFKISTTATTQPWVNLQCFQNGVLVASGWDGYFAGSLTGTTFGLYSPSWTGGAAKCTAYLTTPTWAVLAKTSFDVGA